MVCLCLGRLLHLHHPSVPHSVNHHLPPPAHLFLAPLPACLRHVQDPTLRHLAVSVPYAPTYHPCILSTPPARFKYSLLSLYIDGIEPHRTDNPQSTINSACCLSLCLLSSSAQSQLRLRPLSDYVLFCLRARSLESHCYGYGYGYRYSYSLQFTYSVRFGIGSPMCMSVSFVNYLFCSLGW